jgi:hypothetical protein
MTSIHQGLEEGASRLSTSSNLGVHVGPVVRLETGRTVTVSAPIAIGSKRHEIWYRVSKESVAPTAETFLAAALLPAMKIGAGLHVADPISPRLLRALPKIQDILTTWDRTFQRVSIEAQPAGAQAEPPACGVGCFFSGGVDSWYSVLKHREEISKLILVHGFDIPLENTILRERVSRAIRGTAAELRIPLIEVETNLHEFSRQHLSWEFYHGAALASIALLLSPQFATVYVAASDTYALLVPWGSHPLLDPLWSTEGTEIVHDGCEATREEKLVSIAQSELALRSLRVCWENRDREYNCGRCEKCLRTMAGLRIVKALERCTTFDRPLDLDALSRLGVPPNSHHFLYKASLEAAERLGSDPALAQALRDCLTGRYHKGMWRIVNGARRRLRRLAGAVRRPADG